MSTIAETATIHLPRKGRSPSCDICGKRGQIHDVSAWPRSERPESIAAWIVNACANCRTRFEANASEHLRRQETNGNRRPRWQRFLNSYDE